MRRALIVIVIAAGSVGAVALPEPPDPPPPIAPPEVEIASPVAGVWYCPWVESSFEKAGKLALAATADALATLTFTNPEPGGQADLLDLEIEGPGASLVSVGDIALRGDIPGFAEFSDSAVAAGVIVEGPSTVIAEACIGSVPKVWYLVGGSTRQGESLTLRLFNPFPETAKVSIAAASEFGAEPLTSLEAITVSPRTWTDINMATILRLRDVLAITVTGDEGIVFPAMVAANADDEAMWVGSGIATEWEFPIAGAGSLAGSVALFNPSSEPTLVEIDIVSPDGLIEGVEVAQVGPGEPVTVDLSDAVGGTFAVRVRSERAVAAVVVARGGGGLAATVGAAGPAKRWLLPGAGLAQDGVRSLWLMNSGPEPATISLRALGSDGAGTVEKVAVPAGSLRQFIIEPTTAYVAESLTPFVAGWSAQSAEAAAYSIGVPVSSE